MSITIANPIAAMQAGAQYGAQVRDMQRQNALAQLYQSQGAGIASGDQNAINALAALDPQAAMDAQKNALSMQSTRQDMQFSAERLQMARDEAARAAQDHAAKMTAEQRQAEIDKTNTVLSGAAAMYSKGDKAGYDAFLSSHSLDPAQYPFEQFPAFAAMADGVLETLKTFDAMKPQAPEWRPATPEEAKANGAVAGQINTKTGKFDAQNPPSGMSVVSDGNGGVTVTQGPGAGAGPQPGNIAIDPRQIDNVVASIDDIMKDPNLGRITGPIMGGGGNDVNQLNIGQRMYYGSGGLSLVEKINQLQSTTWLAARGMLKGGGAITDYESQKAEAAMARLSRVKNEADFKAALKDLRDAVTTGQEKLIAAGKLPAAQQSPQQPAQAPEQAQSAPKAGDVIDGYVFNGGDPADPNSWSQVQQ